VDVLLFADIFKMALNARFSHTWNADWNYNHYRILFFLNLFNSLTFTLNTLLIITQNLAHIIAQPRNLNYLIDIFFGKKIWSGNNSIFYTVQNHTYKTDILLLQNNS